MKAVKWMLFGIALILLGLCGILAACLGGADEVFLILGNFCPLLGMIVCCLAMTRKD